MDYRIVESLGATEGAPAAGSAEIVVDITTTGATLAAIAKMLPQWPAGGTVLGFNYDTGERYLSVPDFLPE